MVQTRVLGFKRGSQGGIQDNFYVNSPLKIDCQRSDVKMFTNPTTLSLGSVMWDSTGLLQNDGPKTMKLGRVLCQNE